MARYGKEFKRRAVARLLPPESSSVEKISAEMGVRAETLERWRAEALSEPERERTWKWTPFVGQRGSRRKVESASQRYAAKDRGRIPA